MDFCFWNELKTQLVQHPTSATPAELRALFDPRASLNVDRQPLDVQD